MPAAKTRGDRVIAFIHRYCRAPEGKHVGKPLRLSEFQKRFIREVYDNPHGTSRAYLSIARKNGKTVLIACLVLAHLIGPEARLNSQIISGARSREQAALVFKAALKMVRLSPELSRLVHSVDSKKELVGLAMNVEYRAISAEAGTAHGLSPVLAILDEVGQVKGPSDAFVEAITTAQGAYDDALLIAISTQAATDADLFSVWIDDAAKSRDPHIVSHVYSADADCDLMDKSAWEAANPGLGAFRSMREITDRAEIAARVPAEENSFRWLYLNQRIAGDAPLLSASIWKGCGSQPDTDFSGCAVYGALDLSEVRDLTSLTTIAKKGGQWQVVPKFWLPSDGLSEKSKADRVPYDVWARHGFLETIPGRTVDYDWVAARLFEMHQKIPFRKIAFDRWNFRHLRPCLLRAGFLEEEVEGDSAIFVQFGQGFQSMSPALRTLEGMVLKKEIAHGDHPVLTMCIANATTISDPAGNRKLVKSKSRGRIDGAVTLAMAAAVAAEDDGISEEPVTSPWDDPNFTLVTQ